MTKSINTRELVLEILQEVLEQNSYSHVVIRAVLTKYAYLEQQERAFINRLAEGTIEETVKIDFILNKYSKVKVRKMKPVIRNILRMGVYQILFMDSVPDSAACNEAVKLAKKKQFDGLSGFVNGVLRTIVRNKENLPYPDKKTDISTYLSVTYSMPRWIVDLWRNSYGNEETEKILGSFLIEGPTSIRCNLRNHSVQDIIEILEKEDVTVERNEKLDYCLYISNYGRLTDLDSFNKGLFYVQDMSSMMVTEVANAKAGDQVIDVCAAPGGKSIHIAEYVGKTGHVTACDLTEDKVDLIRENIERMKLDNVTAIVRDATILHEEAIGTADIVIADLPCSGLGVLGKKTDIKYKMSLEKISELAHLQQNILQVVEQYVKVGGTLVYSTCTINTIENQENSQWFLANHSNYSCISQAQLYPINGRTDGFYIAKFVKNS